ncbi:unnamed protein product [Vitrella brassicaformis CCMP3155]|uniref:Uncharacterized protein n=1 Tax=Vitrella brassicaformis (strain CCMP3155) TaxID=1169540 RepID=A0A0G4EDF0_VITBC|nr:unnamed protein product [Vitrella brassicaformis CCMP3155]|eukprot:CEL93379.1 unnamed protein product [Vitrella brassicaformis CCMP3155]
MSDEEEEKWMALRQEKKVMQAIQARCEELGIPHNQRPFLPLLAHHAHPSRPTGLFISTVPGSVEVTQEEAEAMQRIFAIKMPRLDMSKYGDFSDILPKCAAICAAVDSRHVHLPQVQALLKEVAVILIRVLRGMVRLHNAAILLRALANDNVSTDGLIPIMHRIPPLHIEPLSGEPRVSTADLKELQERQPAPVVTDSNSSIACGALRMIDLGHVLTPKATSHPPPTTIGRLPILACVRKEDQGEDENMWTTTPYHHAPEFSLMYAKEWADQRAARRAQEASGEAMVDMDGWEVGCGMTDEAEIDTLEGRMRELLDEMGERGLYVEEGGTQGETRKPKMWLGEAAILFGLGVEGLSVLLGELMHDYMERTFQIHAPEQPQTGRQLRLRLAIESTLRWAEMLPLVLPEEPDPSAAKGSTPPSLFLRPEPCMQWARDVGMKLRELVVDSLRPMPWERMERLPRGLIDMDERLREMEIMVLAAHWGVTSPPIPAPITDTPIVFQATPDSPIASPQQPDAATPHTPLPHHHLQQQTAPETKPAPEIKGAAAAAAPKAASTSPQPPSTSPKTGGIVLGPKATSKSPPARSPTSTPTPQLRPKPASTPPKQPTGQPPSSPPVKPSAAAKPAADLKAEKHLAQKKEAVREQMASSRAALSPRPSSAKETPSAAAKPGTKADGVAKAPRAASPVPSGGTGRAPAARRDGPSAPQPSSAGPSSQPGPDRAAKGAASPPSSQNGRVKESQEGPRKGDAAAAASAASSHHGKSPVRSERGSDRRATPKATAPGRGPRNAVNSLDSPAPAPEGSSRLASGGGGAPNGPSSSRQSERRKEGPPPPALFFPPTPHPMTALQPPAHAPPPHLPHPQSPATYDYSYSPTLPFQPDTAILIKGPPPDTPQAVQGGWMEGWIWNGVRRECEYWEYDRREGMWEVRSESQDLKMIRKRQWREELESWIALFRCRH